MGTSEAGKTQEQVPPVYNAFLISEKGEPALDEDPAPHTLRHWAEGQRKTRNTQKENKKCGFFIFCFSYWVFFIGKSEGVDKTG